MSAYRVGLGTQSASPFPNAKVPPVDFCSAEGGSGLPAGLFLRLPGATLLMVLRPFPEVFRQLRPQQRAPPGPACSAGLNGSTALGQVECSRWKAHHSPAPAHSVLLCGCSPPHLSLLIWGSKPTPTGNTHHLPGTVLRHSACQTSLETPQPPRTLECSRPQPSVLIGRRGLPKRRGLWATLTDSVIP